MDRSNSVPTAITFIIFVALCIGGFFLIKSIVNVNKENAINEAAKEIGELPNIKVSVGGKYYTAFTTVSYAAQNFISNIPISIDMTDEDSNKKMGCTYFKFNGDALRAKKVIKGDILVYGDSCVIIATGDFKGGSKYKKIAHIYDLENIPTGNQTISFSAIK